MDQGDANTPTKESESVNVDASQAQGGATGPDATAGPPTSSLPEPAVAAGSKSQTTASTAKRPTRLKQMNFEKTSGTIFTNAIVELVADEMQGAGLKLLLWNGSKASIRSRLSGTRTRTSASDSDPQPITLDPVSLDLSVRKAIRFPFRAESFGSSRQLLNDICEVIKQYTNLSDNSVLLAAHAVRASWFPEAPNSPIGLAISGPVSSQSQQLFLVLSCLYRRPILLGEISPAAFSSLPMDLSPSLFIEVCDDTPRFEKLIRATFNRGYIPVKGKLIRTTCATVFNVDEPLSGTISGRNIIEIPVTYPHERLPILSPKTQDEIAEKFQQKLLMYRLANYRHVMNSTFEAVSLTYPVNELARCLAACVVDDPERQADIANLLSDKNAYAKQELSCDLRVTVLEALLDFCHKGKRQSIHVGDVTATANSILEDRGELLQMTSRMVGSKLRVLGFTTIRLDAAGRGIQLSSEMRRRIHRVAWNNGLQLPNESEKQCDQCAEILAENNGAEESRRMENDVLST